MKNDIRKIPDKYIIDRWRKKEKKMISKNKCSLTGRSNCT